LQKNLFELVRSVCCFEIVKLKK